jgi:hypothetical protein
MMRTQALALAAVIVAATLAASVDVRAQAVVNSNGGDGYLTFNGTEGHPSYLELFGSDNAADFGSAPLPNVTSFDWLGGESGAVYIGWNYLDFDVRGQSFDSAGFILDGVPYEFSVGARRAGGTLRLFLKPSDNVGVYVSSVDSEGGRAVISFSLVPELATWALMVAGVGLVGGALRRRWAMHPQLTR